MRSVSAGQPLGEILSKRQKWLLVVSLMLAMFIGAVDQTVVATATPRIVADLGGFNLYAWLATSYMLTSTIVVPLTGKLSDIYGRRTFVLAGIALFFVSSIACGFAPSMVSLVIFRGVQGLGGGMIFASVFASIGDIFPPSERSKFMGLFTGVFSLASILGPTVGGFLTDSGGWRWVFFINVPFCLIAFPAIWRNLPSRHGVVRPRIDWVGASILSVAAVVLLLAFEWAGKDYDWASPQIIGLFIAGALAIAWFVFQESRHPEPILPLYLFKNQTFLISNIVVFIMGMGMFGALQYLGLFVQTALSASATASGIIGTPQSFGLLAASVIGGQVIARTGHYRIQTVLGAVAVFVAMMFLRTIDTDVSRLAISAYMVLLGIGFGLVMPTLSLSVQNAVAYEHLGVASSSSQFFRQIGSVFGIAIFAVVLTNSYESGFENNLSADTRAQLGATVVRFEDPTLNLNPAVYNPIRDSILAQPGGQAVLNETLRAQRESIASAVQDIFTGAAIVAGLSVLLLLMMKEIPLRRTFHATPAADEDGKAVDAPTLVVGH